MDQAPEGVFSRKQPKEGMFDALPAKRQLEMLCATLSFYFPEGQRARYLGIAAIYEARTQDFWLGRIGATAVALAKAVRKMGEYYDWPSSELLMLSWDDDVLFFYVLRTQYVFARLAARPDDMVPGGLDEFWEWWIIPGEKDPWMLFPVLTAEAIKVAAVRPPIWKIPYPVDYPGKP
jgi:hypothetical protein